MPTVDPRRLILVVSAVALVSCTGGASSSSPSGVASSIGPTPAATTALSSPSPTPKPTNTTYTQVKETTNAAQTQITEEYRATWDEPAGIATKFTVYGVTECLRESAKNDDTPCVVEGMHIPASKLTVLATATGDARSMNVTWTRYDEEGPDPYWAILLSASNPYGESKSAILTSGQVCFGCTY